MSESCQPDSSADCSLLLTHKTGATQAVMQVLCISAALQSARFSTFVEVGYKQFGFHDHLLLGFFTEEGCQLLDANCCWERMPVAARHGNFMKSIAVCKEEHKHQQFLYRVNRPQIAVCVTLLNWVCSTWKAQTPTMISKNWLWLALQVEICSHLLKD